MKITDYEVTIAQHYCCAIINNDYSGLSEEEETLIDNYMQHNNYVDLIVLYGELENSNFTRCDISNLYANCYDVKFILKE